MPRMTRAVIPPGAWPARMTVELAAGYVGETRIDAFLSRVGAEYPRPRIDDGERKLWLRADLDRAIAPDLTGPEDAAEVL